jgi:hypothetical protein
MIAADVCHLLAQLKIHVEPPIRQSAQAMPKRTSNCSRNKTTWRQLARTACSWTVSFAMSVRI